MNLLANYRKQFAFYRSLGERAMEQLGEEELFFDDAAGSNSIAVIVKHLAGNMHSRWTDLLTSDGEKPWRDRDQEFVDDFADRAALENAWNLLEAALLSLNETDLDRTVYIRAEAHTVYEAINRQLAHYAYHVGQIVLLAKQCKGENWVSLSIAKGQSEAFNASKFGR
ncbi:DUF1572 family protein [Neolewinella antarctica]|uniref:Damage-inducible protein DinB n=1 Tax=Neolewinella antarctica TaxID=442734 RepID=A0ABX0XEG7_9BACT|nr:DUF1572 family protein [Neolewinella antarctica]NJC27716.1 putative damage-inducible protein DinB [Neolewinella antarctica]